MKGISLFFVLFFLHFGSLMGQCPAQTTCEAETKTLEYSLDGVVKLELIPQSEIVSGQCLLGNCSHDKVINIFLEDILPGEPCFLADNLLNRCNDDVGFDVFSVEGDGLVVAIASLFNVIFNSGDKCISILECAFDDIANLLAQEYDIDDCNEIDIRIIEAAVPKQVLDENCSPSCCVGNRLIINFVIPSFCGSACIEPRPNVCYPFSPSVADWLIYRYELLKAKKAIRDLISLTTEERGLVREQWIREKGLRFDSTEFIEGHQTFRTDCLPLWEDVLSPTIDK